MRQSNESYDEYRKRLKRERLLLKKKLKGKIYHNAYSYFDDKSKFHPGKGTYKKGVE